MVEGGGGGESGDNNNELYPYCNDDLLGLIIEHCTRVINTVDAVPRLKTTVLSAALICAATTAAVI